MTERSSPNPVATRPSTPLSGVLETIAAGLSLAIARPYLVILPLLIDLTTWLGLQISALALINPIGRTMEEQGGTNGPAAAEQLAEIGQRFRVNDLSAILTPSAFSGLPRDSLLNAMVSVIAAPLADGIDRTDMGDVWTDGIFSLWVPSEWWTVLGAMAAAFAVATVLIVLFRVPIARSVRERGEHRGIVAEAMMAWVRVLALLGMVALVAGLVIAPLLVVSAILLVLGLDVAALLTVALLLVGGLASIYTLFVLDAMFLERLGPIAAVARSVSIVRAHFGSTLRFALASLVLATGALQVWGTIADEAPGVVIALIGNAVLGTGLSIASMMFFQDRAAATALPASRRDVPAGRSRWRP